MRLHAGAQVSQLQAVINAIKGAQKPVIYYGGGCQDVRDELREFCRKVGGRGVCRVRPVWFCI